MKTEYETWGSHVSLLDIHNVEEVMSKEELVEMNRKILSLMGSLPGIKDAQTHALIEKMLRYGYYMAHMRLGGNT